MSNGIREIEGNPIPSYFYRAYYLRDESIAPRLRELDAVLSPDELYSASSTKLTYQQIQWLINDGLLLPAEGPDGHKWKRYRFRDLVYISAISALRKFGVGNKALHGLFKLFYETPASADQAILACFNADETILLFHADGTGFVLSSTKLMDALGDDSEMIKRPSIYLILNQAVDDVLKDVGKEPIEVRTSIGKMIHCLDLSPKECKVLDALRNNDYISVEVRKKDGEPNVLYGTQIMQMQSVTPDETRAIHNDTLLAMITKDYADIQIVRRDGETVYLNVKESFHI